MSLTPSTMLDLGTAAPDFSLPDPAGNLWQLSSFNDKPALLVIFMCNHCPYVIHIRNQLAAFTSEYQAKGLAVVGISANDVDAHPDDSPELMAVEIQQAGYTFPYLYDETQAVAKAYQAACTPDFFLFDDNRQLVYRGQFDDSRPGNNIPITGGNLRAAVNALLSGDVISADQIASVGCNIKWKPGNEPDYFS